MVTEMRKDDHIHISSGFQGRSSTCEANLRCDVEANDIDVCPRSENYIGCLRVAVDLQRVN
jgi:hypothetical protein